MTISTEVYGKDLNYLKRMNRVAILNILRSMGPLSKTQLAQMSNLNNNTILNIIDYFIKKDIVVSVGLRRTDAGRKKIHFRINENFGYSIGIDLGASHISVIIINLEGKIILEKTYNYRFGLNSSILLEKIISLTQNIISQSEIDENKILGIGFSAPGFFDNRSGIWKQAVNINEWKSIPIRKILQNQFTKDIYLQDSSRSMALSEFWYGKGKKYNNLIFIDIGDGIGMGIIINQALYEGYGQKSGEIGHLSVEENGRRCNCNKYGCLETVASGKSIVNIVQEKIRSGYKSKILDLVNNHIDAITPIDIVEAAGLNDNLAIEVLQNAGNKIGKAISHVINLFNPELIVIGGQLSQAGKYLIDPIHKAVNQYSLSELLQDVTITLSSTGPLSAARGAATITINDKIFSL